MRFNKATEFYTPVTWWVGSLGDHILNILISLFDAYDAERPDDFSAFAFERLGLMNWCDQLYLKDYVLGITIRIHESLTSEEQ